MHTSIFSICSYSLCITASGLFSLVSLHPETQDEKRLVSEAEEKDFCSGKKKRDSDETYIGTPHKQAH
jgi:hypothetical protein